MRPVRIAAAFVWDFVVGEDWRLALGVLGVLALGAALAALGAGGGTVAVVVGLGLLAVAALRIVRGGRAP